MSVVLPVTIDAGGRRLSVRGAGPMTGLAGNRHVRLRQREVRQVMREAGLAQFVDVSITAQMFGMAATALSGSGLGHPPVIAGFRADIGGRVLVAVEAQYGLPVPVGAVMATAAIGLDLRVRLTDGPRHDELLDVCRAASRSERRCEQGKQQRLRQGPLRKHEVGSDQYTCTETTCTMPAAISMRNSGMCRTCHSENSFS